MASTSSLAFGRAGMIGPVTSAMMSRHIQNPMDRLGRPIPAYEFVRHGSAEHGRPSWMRRRRSPSPDRNNRGRGQSMTPLARDIPAGPQEATEWTTMMGDLELRVKQLEKQQLRMAESIGKHTTQIVSNRTQSHGLNSAIQHMRKATRRDWTSSMDN